MESLNIPLEYLLAAAAVLVVLLLLARRGGSAQRGFDAALAEGWIGVGDGDLRTVLREFPPLSREGAALTHAARKAIRGMEVMVCRYTAGNVDEAWLVLPMPGQAPTAMIRAKAGGAIPQATLETAQAAGMGAYEPGAAWEWADVAALEASHWFSRSRGQELQSLLSPPRALWIHRRSAVVAVPATAFPSLVASAEQLADGLFRAIAH